MSAVARETQPVTLQAGYRAVALEPGNTSSALRLSVVIKESPDPVGGPFVSLGETTDASIYLGCVIDADGHPHEWLEIWIQNLERLEERHPGYECLFCNELLDRQWQRQAALWKALDPDTHIATRWERVHPLPLYLDLALQHAHHPRDLSTGEHWALCIDDAALVAAGLPPYSTSLARYLCTTGTEQAPARYASVSANAVESSATLPLKEAIGNLVPFNPAGGLMMVRRFAPLSIDEWSDLLSGTPWKGVVHGRKAFRLGPPYNTLQDANAIQQDPGYLLLSSRGRAGRLLESYHLKLQALVAAFEQCRAWVEREQLPFLNLSTESFRVALPNVTSSLPRLWSARTELGRPGKAIALPVQSTDARYFTVPDGVATSIFRPASVHAGVQGQATMRVRKVDGEESGASIEGTLVTNEQVKISASDLLCLQFALPAGRVELYAHWVEESEGLSSQELRFKTLPQQLSGAVLTSLREAEGVALPHVSFATSPVVSTPGDLYSLAVVATRLLLVNAETPLPAVFDELLSFGKLLAEQHDPSKSLAERAGTLARSDDRWQTSLGPQRLLCSGLEPEEALGIFPEDLWWETIGLLLRLIPGLGPDSFCRDFGDAPSLALERAFDGPLAALADLSTRSRSLIAIDWTHNREIRSVLESFIARTN